MRAFSGGRFDWSGLVLLAVACNNPGAATTSPNSAPVGGGGTSSTVTVDGGSTGATVFQPVAVFASFTPQNALVTGGSGGGGGAGTGPQGIVAPYGISSSCGDAIVGPTEECDDGDSGSDACTAECQTRDQAATVVENAVIDRYLGAGRHPVSGLADGFIATYVEQAGEEPSIGATVFDIWGKAKQRGSVSEGASPIDEANPVAVALPGGKYAVAWSDFDSDGADLGVALRQIAPDGSLGPLLAANAERGFSQLNPDMLWTGTEVVVAWEDYSDPFNGPDLRYRRFDQDLNPLSDDLTLAGGDLPEAAVALAAFNGAWAAAYREGTADGKENIVVKVGEAAFRVGPVQGGPLDDRPALVGLDATHWLVAFSVGTDPTATGVYNLPRLRYAVIDTQSAVAPAIQALDPLDDVFSNDNQIAQLTPSLETAAEGAYLAWRSEARPGDASGDQIWLKLMRWLPAEASQRIRGEEAELLIPRTCDGSIGDQRAPALARTQLPPGGALAIAWTDFGRTLGATSGEPDVLVHYAPTHLSSPSGAPQQVVETWSGPPGGPWPGRWSSNAAPPVTLTTQYGQAQFNALSGPGSVLAWVNDHTARDVDIVTTVRFNNSSQYIGVFARRADDKPNSYVGALLTTSNPDVWRTFSVAPDAATGQPVATLLQTMPMPKGFAYETVGVQVDHRLRFRVVTNADGSVFVGLKYWRLGAPEPGAWLLQDQYGASSALALQLGQTAGRFGVLANAPTANGGRMYFDDFSATFFEGNTQGNLDSAPSSVPLLLPRAVATYRRCNAQNVCSVASGCCALTQDCAAGLACDRTVAESLGVGSHASTCVTDHCTDQKKNSTETRTDCGGADCKACTCTTAALPGAAGYCGPTCLCGVGEAPCSRDGDCMPGLLCGANAAEPFGGAWDADACVPPHCLNRLLDVAAGETAVDCGGECGSNCVCSQVNGLRGHCRAYCPCSLGNGHCLNDQDCVSPLICDVAKGPKYGFPAGTSVCLPPSCQNNKRDAALGETSVDCGGPCGCGGCPAGCTTSVAPVGETVPISTVTPYSQTFDGIGNAALATLPSGWRVDKQASPRVVGTFTAAGTTTVSRAGAAMSSASTNSIYNFGAGVAATGAAYWLNAADRAVGWLATGAAVGSGGTKSGNLYVQLQAPANTEIKSLTVSYGVEKYRNGTTAPGWKVQLFYSADGITWASAGSTFTTSFAADVDSNGYDPAPGSSTVTSGTLDAFVPRGAPFFLAWNYTTSAPASVDATNAQALAIDDVTIVGAASQ